MSTFANPLADLLAFFYAPFHSYGIAIMLLTLVVMVVLLPLTVKGTRSMLAMQKLAPEIKKLQEKHKNDRQKLSEETMALYRDNKINPLGGCFPLLLQLPVFLVLYHVINGLGHKTKEGIPDPLYLSQNSDMYRDLVADGGRMVSFGIDLAKRATSPHGSFWEALPFYGLILLMVGLQYFQQWQVTSRAPAADTPQAQQMRMIQKFFPPIFGIFSINFPAGVVLYWVISSLFRVGQQWAMYRYDPLLKTTVASAKKEAEGFLAEKDSPRAQKANSNNNRSNKKKKRKGK